MIPTRRVSDHCPTDPNKRCELADAAARAAVTEVFSKLGVDVDDPEKVKALQRAVWAAQDLEAAKRHGWIVIVGLIATAILSALVAGVKIKLGGN